jgi:DNA-binding PadR family transcriptional regulator
MPKRESVDRFLPLKPVAFHILLALADGPRHGYAIRTAVEELTQKGIRLWPATLYGSVRQLSAAGLMEPIDGEGDPDDDARRRYYQLTRLGQRVLAAETERLRAIVDYARGTRAIAET